MDQSKLTKISEELIGISRQHGSDRVKITADYDQALQHAKKFNYQKAASFPIGDDSIVEKVRQLANDSGNKRVWVLVNKYDSTTDVYTLTEEALAEASPSKNTSGCFIATAVYGTESASEVMFLKGFRDDVLLSSAWGEIIVKIYYQISPPISKLISKHMILKNITKVLFIQPAISGIKIFSRRK